MMCPSHLYPLPFHVLVSADNVDHTNGGRVDDDIVQQRSCLIAHLYLHAFPASSRAEPSCLTAVQSMNSIFAKCCTGHHSVAAADRSVATLVAGGCCMSDCLLVARCKL